MKFDDITTLRCFRLIYETKSLTKTSESIGLSKAALSKRLESFEMALGFKLFSRTTRAMVPTLNADKLISQITDILDRIDGLNLNSDLKTNDQLKIRMTCPATMSQRFIGELLHKYRSEHPTLKIELLVTDSLLDLVEHGIDIAIRYNPSHSSHLVGKKIGLLKLVAVATPEYLKKNKPIRKTEDLLFHDLLFIDHHLGAFDSYPKSFHHDLKAKRLFLTNDSPLITQLLLKGHGVGIRSLWDVKESIKEKKLALALPENSFKPQGDIWILSGPDRLKSEAVRGLYNFLAEHVSERIN